MPPTPPLAGDKPQPYISLSTLGRRCSGDGGWCRRPAPEFIPDRSPGHAFLPMTRAGSGGIREKAAGTRQVGHPTPGWGQAPALHFSFDPGPSLFGRRWLVSPAGAGIHPGSESGTCVPTNDQSGKWWDSREGCRHPPGWPPHPWLGTSPSPTFLCSDSRREPAIPDQSPGHAFAPTTLTRLVHIGLNSYDRSDCLTGGGAVITLRTVLRFPNLDTGEASRTNHEWPILRKNSTNQAKLLRR